MAEDGTILLACERAHHQAVAGKRDDMMECLRFAGDSISNIMRTRSFSRRPRARSMDSLQLDERIASLSAHLITGGTGPAPGPRVIAVPLDTGRTCPDLRDGPLDTQLHLCCPPRTLCAAELWTLSRVFHLAICGAGDVHERIVMSDLVRIGRALTSLTDPLFPFGGVASGLGDDLFMYPLDMLSFNRTSSDDGADARHAVVRERLDDVAQVERHHIVDVALDAALGLQCGRTEDMARGLTSLEEMCRITASVLEGGTEEPGERDVTLLRFISATLALEDVIAATETDIFFDTMELGRSVLTSSYIGAYYGGMPDPVQFRLACEHHIEACASALDTRADLSGAVWQGVGQWYQLGPDEGVVLPLLNARERLMRYRSDFRPPEDAVDHEVTSASRALSRQRDQLLDVLDARIAALTEGAMRTAGRRYVSLSYPEGIVAAAEGATVGPDVPGDQVCATVRSGEHPEWDVTRWTLVQAQHFIKKHGYLIDRLGTSQTGEPVLVVDSHVVALGQDNLDRDRYRPLYECYSCREFREQNGTRPRLCKHLTAALIIMGRLGEREGVDLSLLDRALALIREEVGMTGIRGRYRSSACAGDGVWECRAPREGV
ncbi:MAG: hypothetical protein QGG26_15865 [Candidatus Undinarchaeales archaeon]|nr:hypothetical protein [Candidatus Undinarchaeales archaeon]